MQGRRDFRGTRNKAFFDSRRQLGVWPRPDPHDLASGWDRTGGCPPVILPTCILRNTGQAWRQHKYLLEVKVCQVTLGGILSH